MELRVVTSTDIVLVLEKLQVGLESAGFVFVETNRSYVATADRDGITKTLGGATFWARKQLSDPSPPTHSIEIEGDVTRTGKETAIRVDFYEFHDRRKHALGGSHGLQKHLDDFCAMLLP